MSATISFSPTSMPMAAAVRRSRLRLTRRGRAVLTLLVALPVVIALVVGFFAGASALAEGAAPAGTAPASFEYVTVQPGQSLWELASELAPSADPRDVIQEIKALNALDSSAVNPGQRLAIPASLR